MLPSRASAAATGLGGFRTAIDAIDPAPPTGSRDQTILLLLATTGIRSKKLRSLVLDDIRRRDAQVRVRHTKARRDRSVPPHAGGGQGTRRLYPAGPAQLRQPSRVPRAPPPSASNRRQHYHLPHCSLGLAASRHRARRSHRCPSHPA
ncbi:tyrosine-type recombinase/integrase [Microvirga tunisiensis]|uniref:tyrosine-type recombinase/integrase n=1 Tax=Microvirga tunisiensis TaxID=2108360 RepID=UPI003B84A49D